MFRRSLPLAVCLGIVVSLSGSPSRLVAAEPGKDDAHHTSAISAVSAAQDNTAEVTSEYFTSTLDPSAAEDHDNTTMKCYQCNSRAKGEEDCLKAKEEVPKSFLKGCPLNHDGKEPQGCWRLSFKIPETDENNKSHIVERLVRSCAYTKVPEDKWSVHQSEFGSVSNQQFCNTTACNHSARINTISGLSVLLSFITTVTSLWALFN